jgi:hypothetical protein
MTAYFFIKPVTAFLLCLCSVSYAQTILHVESSEDHTALPYASIVNHTKHSLLFTDEQGNAAVNFTNGDSISISYIGYQMIKTVFTSKQKQDYILKQNQNLLEPVQIQNCKNWSGSDYTNLTADINATQFGGVAWDKGAMNAKIAVMLRPSFKQARLKAFSIWLKRDRSAPKVAVRAPIKLSFYSINDSSFLPGELISGQQVIYHPEKEGRQMIGLDSLHLAMPQNGMYVGIEYVMNEQYEWPFRYLDENGIDTILIRYGVNIDGVYSKDFSLAFYNYENDHWFFPAHRDKSTLGKIHGTIKCSAEILSCKDE